MTIYCWFRCATFQSSACCSLNGLQVQADIGAVRDLQYFMRFALGVYGWLLHAFRHAHKGLICAPCALSKLAPCVQAGCSCLCTKRNLGVQGDNCCRCNQTAVLKTFGEFWSPAHQPVSTCMALRPGITTVPTEAFRLPWTGAGLYVTE
eukprot:COSAG02_NODE_2312_length_9165_cov_13.956872_4_plen_149_part_00